MQQAILDRWQQEYRDLQPAATRFSEKLVAELQQMLQKQRIPLATPIEYRVKGWLSIEEKIVRQRFHGISLRDLHDFVGVRLILLFRRDVPIVCDLIESALEICGRSDRAEELSYQTFGYQSMHYIVRPPKSWQSVPTFSAVGIFQAEVQVRTLAQHMWAAASHGLQYKQEESVPPPMRRTIHRVSALLEIVDLEFERVLVEREEYRKSVRSERRSRHLNADVLATILDELLPDENKGVLEPYSLLLWELDKLGIETSGQLSGIIEKHLPSALDGERAYLERLHQSDPSHAADRKSIFTHLGLVRLMLQMEFGVNFFDGKIWEELEKEDDAENAGGV